MLCYAQMALLSPKTSWIQDDNLFTMFSLHYIYIYISMYIQYVKTKQNAINVGIKHNNE